MEALEQALRGKKLGWQKKDIPSHPNAVEIRGEGHRDFGEP